MSKPKLKLIITALSCLLTIITSVQSIQTSKQSDEVTHLWQFIPSWSFYDKTRNFTLSNGINTNHIVFSIWANQVNTTYFQIIQQGYWKSSYKSQHAQINVVGYGQNLLAKIYWRDPINMLNFTIYEQGRSNSPSKITLIYDKKPLTEQHFSNINGCDEWDNGLNCAFNYSKTVEIQFDPTGVNSTNIIKMRKIMQEKTQINIDAFLQKLNINPNSTQYTQKLARQMLQNTLSSLCSQKVSYYEDRYFGLCSSSNPKEIDLHYSLLVIDILFNYDAEMGVWLTENFLNLLQQKLFYEFKGKQWIPTPEHIEVFVTYLRQITKNKSLTQTQIRESINKVIEIQNGLINSLLLSQVNHLSQQINYRQNNKIHPTIMKMLTQAWKTDSPRARVSSIYAESFTNDFYYHQQNQKLDTSVGKMMWLLKLINQHLMVVRTWGDSFQKESLEQLVSLAKVMHGFILEDQRAKNGDFHSIIEAENLRLYTRSVGYESLLPFAYDISPVFPTTTMLNLTTSAGLASMPLAHEKAKQTYNFRGNINLYFNFKILFNMVQRCQSNPKFRVFYPGLKTVIESIQRSIIATYAQGKNNEVPKFYTSWTAKGKGVSSERHLGVINLAFLEELKQIPQGGSTGRENKAKQERKQTTQ